MKRVKVEELHEGQTVYYIPSHLSTTLINAEKGYVTTLKDRKVWVRYKGPQGNLTPINNLYT